MATLNYMVFCTTLSKAIQRAARTPDPCLLQAVYAHVIKAKAAYKCKNYIEAETAMNQAVSTANANMRGSNDRP